MTGAASVTTTRDPVKIIANIFISFIGAGVLGLPYAFKRVSEGRKKKKTEENSSSFTVNFSRCRLGSLRAFL